MTEDVECYQFINQYFQLQSSHSPTPKALQNLNMPLFLVLTSANPAMESGAKPTPEQVHILLPQVQCQPKDD